MNKLGFETAFVDEAGYTGPDLLNEDQPFLGLSAVFVTPEEATSLCKNHFPDTHCRELKHKTLSRRPSHHKALTALQRECLKSHKAISFVANKRFMCIRMLLDTCIEPSFHARGINFYEDGFDVSLANILYFTGPSLFGPQQFNDLLVLFQRAVKSKSDQDINIFCEHTRSMRKCALSEWMSPISKEFGEFIVSIKHPSSSTDIAFSMLFALLTRLEKTAEGNYEVVHDTSPAMHTYHDALKNLIKQPPQRSFTISNDCAIKFPLRLNKIREGSSHLEPGLQLADILVGGITKASVAELRGETTDTYAASIQALYDENNFIHILPDADLDGIAARFHNTQSAEMISILGEAMRREKHL